jgi:hypothetical protein
MKLSLDLTRRARVPAARAVFPGELGKLNITSREFAESLVTCDGLEDLPAPKRS